MRLCQLCVPEAKVAGLSRLLLVRAFAVITCLWFVQTPTLFTQAQISPLSSCYEHVHLGCKQDGGQHNALRINQPHAAIQCGYISQGTVAVYWM